jgi:DNA invertase Pin-like site-specific DNA recombinase
VSFTVDKETSGGVPARKREDLGPWLTDPGKVQQWDILAAAKLDRGWRSVLDFAQTQEWADERGKALVSVAEGYDFTTPEGELMAYQLIAFAQFERKRGAQRRSEAAEIITLAGRWDGGRFPYGYAPVGSKGNYRLALDETTAPIARRMVADAINGKGLLTIAKELNATGIPSPLGREWRDNAVRRVLVSPALMGYVTRMIGPHNNIVTVLRDDQGQPVKFTDNPLITEDQYRKLQDSIKARARSRGEPQARHLLWGVVLCRNCSEPCGDQHPCAEHDVKLYGARRVKNPTKGNYYRCKRNCGVTLRLELLEDHAEEFVLSQYGDSEQLEPVTIPGDDHSVVIARLERRAERLRSELDEDYDPDLERSIRTIEGKVAALKSAPHQPERVKWMPVVPAITVAENWARIDTEGRNKFLRTYGIRFYADRQGITSYGAYVLGTTGRGQPVPLELVSPWPASQTG